MSSINQNQPGYANATNYTTVQPTTHAPSTSDVSAVTGTQPAPISLDSFTGQSTSAAADILGSRPPIATDARPVNYTTNLQSAQSNLSSFSSLGGGSATEMALLAKENLAANKTSNSINKMNTATSDIENRQRKTTAQAKSIVESAETSHKQHCKTKHDNHDDNLAKMKKLGFTPKQAEAMLRTLEDHNTPKDAKDKLAYQLAAIGMCGASGTGLTKATATNVSAIREQLGKFADGQSKALNNLENQPGVLAKTGKKLKDLMAPDLATAFSTSSLAGAASHFKEDGLSGATRNASAISSAALTAAYPNLTTVA